MPQHAFRPYGATMHPNLSKYPSSLPRHLPRSEIQTMQTSFRIRHPQCHAHSSSIVVPQETQPYILRQSTKHPRKTPFPTIPKQNKDLHGSNYLTPSLTSPPHHLPHRSPPHPLQKNTNQLSQTKPIEKLIQTITQTLILLSGSKS